MWMRVVTVVLLLGSLIGLSAALSDGSGDQPPATEETDVARSDGFDSATADSSNKPSQERAETEPTPENSPSESHEDPDEPEQPRLVGPKVGFDGYQLSAWLMPWDDGFLRIGYLPSDEQPQARARLFAQTSDDGIHWSDPMELDIPYEHRSILESQKLSREIHGYHPEEYFYPIIRSDGNRLVVVTHFPDGYLAIQGARANLSRQAGPLSADIKQGVFVSVTSDLSNWDNFDIPLEPADELDKSLSVVISAIDAIVTDERLLIQLSTLTYSDIRNLVPEYIRESAKTIYWSYPPAVVDESNSIETVFDGYRILWTFEDPESGAIETREQDIPWDEFSPVSDAFFDYLITGNKPYHYGNRYSTSVIELAWGEEPKHHDLPSGLGIQVSIVPTASGYAALSDTSLPGYSPGINGFGRLLVSPDGSDWSFSSSWDSDVLSSRVDSIGIREAGLTFGLASVEEGILVRGADRDPDTMNPYYSYHFWPETLFLGNPQGTEWNDITAEAYLLDQPFASLLYDKGQIRSQGTGAIFRTFAADEPSEESSRLVYLHTLASVDGRDWFRFVEETYHGRATSSSPWSAAFNGNVVVLVDPDGNSHRYELP